MVITGTAAKAADRYAIDVLGIPSLELMERASSFVADHIIKTCPGKSVLIISGMGNNGADGICIGRMLRENGFDPLVVCCGDEWKGTWEYYRQLSDYRRIGGRILPLAGAEGQLPDADVLVDAVFGIGLKREVEGGYRDLIGMMNSHRGLKISVDVPSGINADTGEEMGICFAADMTFTFGKNKTGLVEGAGPEASGKVTVCDIGIPEAAYEQVL
ncbi:MAG: NAD(P)H-hydrate epimerase [Lachnospiraceae bacterium]|nr:NAD(P)H-hydrate epimerase [Lachnospiraceae bacterium]